MMMQVLIPAVLATALAGGGAVTSTDPLGAELVRSLTNMGAYTQLATECGAPQDVVARVEASNLDLIATMKEKSSDLGIDFDKVYANGRETGHKKFASLGADARQSMECSRAISIISSMP
jgi:hypothetical protein